MLVGVKVARAGTIREVQMSKKTASCSNSLCLFDDCCDSDGGGEQVPASVVAGGDSAPVLEAREWTRDSVVLYLVFRLVDRVCCALDGRDAAVNRQFGGLVEPVVAAPLAGQEYLGR